MLEVVREALLVFAAHWCWLTAAAVPRCLAMRSRRWRARPPGRRVRTPRRFYGSGFSRSGTSEAAVGSVRRGSVGIRAWARLLELDETVVEAVEFDEDEGPVVVSVRPRYSQRDRCPPCLRRCPGYHLGEGRRRWRALDLGTTFCYLEADAPRVTCKEHGVVVAAVPWARHDAWFTRSFDATAARVAVNT